MSDDSNHTTRGPLPGYTDLPQQAGMPASWGLWGDIGTDRFGCLNLLSPAKVVAAATLIRKGVSFPLNWSMQLPKPPLFGRSEFRHEVTGAPGSTSHDDVLHDWNTQSSSQWDGFRHIRNHKAAAHAPGTGHYGGVVDEDHGMAYWAQRGIVGRAVVADVGRYRESIGRPLDYDSSDIIEPEELLDCLTAQGTTVESGDILLLRTGWVGWYESQPADVRRRISPRAELKAPGLRSSEATARTLWDLHISAIGADNPSVETWPPGTGTDPAIAEAARANPELLHEIFIHLLLLPMLGIPLGEMWNLEALAADCAADGTYECFFTSAPLNLPSGVASPPNAIAIR